MFGSPEKQVDDDSESGFELLSLGHLGAASNIDSWSSSEDGPARNSTCNACESFFSRLLSGLMAKLHPTSHRKITIGMIRISSNLFLNGFPCYREHLFQLLIKQF
jgi:hypothetical protein